jgi:Lysozyme like domain
MGISDAPIELQVAIREFWPESEWDHAADVSWLESGWDAFALADTTSDEHPCGSIIDHRGGVAVAAERSVGYFQVNSCNFPGWEWQRLYNARHNAGTAHALWDTAGQSWRPWYFSAQKLGLG